MLCVKFLALTCFLACLHALIAIPLEEEYFLDELLRPNRQTKNETEEIPEEIEDDELPVSTTPAVPKNENKNDEIDALNGNDKEIVLSEDTLESEESPYGREHTTIKAEDEVHTTRKPIMHPEMRHHDNEHKLVTQGPKRRNEVDDEVEGNMNCDPSNIIF